MEASVDAEAPAPPAEALEFTKVAAEKEVVVDAATEVEAGAESTDSGEKEKQAAEMAAMQEQLAAMKAASTAGDGTAADAADDRFSTVSPSDSGGGPFSRDAPESAGEIEFPRNEDADMHKNEKDIYWEAREQLGEEVALSIPQDIWVSFVRGFMYEKDWLGEVVKWLGKNAEFRKDNKCNQMLEMPSPHPTLNDKQELFNATWKSEIAGKNVENAGKNASFAHCDAGMDMDGHPIVIEHVGAIDPKALLENFDEESIKLHHVYNQERMRALKAEISKKSGKRIYKAVVVLDLGGLGSKHLSSTFYKQIKSTIDIDQWFYPETLWKVGGALLKRALPTLYFVPLPNLSFVDVHYQRPLDFHCRVGCHQAVGASYNCCQDQHPGQKHAEESPGYRRG
jgi:hypothetical protein